jgi:hypothetical protein
MAVSFPLSSQSEVSVNYSPLWLLLIPFFPIHSLNFSFIIIWSCRTEQSGRWSYLCLCFCDYSCFTHGTCWSFHLNL